MSKYPLFSVFLGMAAIFIVPAALAVTVVPLTDEQLAKQAELIVVGRVLSAHYEVDVAEKRPYTFIHVQVNEFLKGRGARELTLKTMGGYISKMGMQIPGAADFHRNEEVMLFLERRPDGGPFPVGLYLGKYSIYRDEQTGRKLVIRRSDGNGKYFAQPRESTIRDLQPDQKMYLDDFRQKIRQFVQR